MTTKVATLGHKLNTPVIKLLIACLILGLILYLIDPSTLIAHLIRTDLTIFSVVTVCWGFVVLICSWRWHKVANSIGIELGLVRSWKLFNIGNLYNFVLPGAVGGDAIKSAIIARETRHRMSAILSVLFDRIIALWGIIVLGVFSSITYILLYEPKLTGLIPALLLAIVGIFGVIYVVSATKTISKLKWLIPKRLQTKISSQDWEHLKTSIEYYRHHPRLFALGLLLTFFGQLATYTLIFFLGVAVGLDADMKLYMISLIILPIMFLVSTLPITPAGLGTSEIACMTLFSRFGVTPEVSLAMPLLYRASLSIFSLHALAYHFTDKSSQSL